MLTLRCQSDTRIPVEAECIRPDLFASKSLAEIARTPVQHGNTQVALGEFFAASGDPSAGEIVIEGDCSRVKLIGSGMSAGRIIVHGNAGMHLGAEMTGGLIEVHGDAGDWVGAEMKGGRIHVHGNAGHLVGAAYRGSRFGMRGGVILVHGRAGNEIGATMRRGLIAIGGDAGDFVGVSVIAGTIVVGGRPGERPGADMQRGSLVFLDPRPLQLLPTFRHDCEYRPAWLAIYLRQLRDWAFPVRAGIENSRWRHYRGDLLRQGKGEVLHRLETGS